MALFVRDRSFYRKILLLGGPISAQQIITVGVNMMDTVMLGQLDETALSASSMAAQVHNLFHFMCMGLGMGASVLIARYWGAEEHASLRKTLVLMYRFCLLTALVFTAAVAAAPAGIMGLLTPDGEVVAEGVRYLRWALPCFFLYGLSMTTTIVLRNTGQMHIPLLTAVGAFFLNIFFNWMFIFGTLGAPAMGVAGAALGTLISRAFEFAVICGYFLLRDRKLRFRVRDLLLPCGDLLPEYLRISLPVLVSDTLLGLGNSMTMAVAGHIGRTFMSANTITSVTQQITTVFTAGLGQAAVIITGNTLGLGEMEKAVRRDHCGGQPSGGGKLPDHGGDPRRGDGADERGGIDNGVYGRQFHPDQGGAPGWRRHPFLDGCRRVFPLGCQRTAGGRGGPGVGVAALLDLFLPAHRPRH